MHTATSYLILYFRRIPILPTTFYMSYAYRYFLPDFDFPNAYRYFLIHLIFYHILYFQRIAILFLNFILLTHCDTFDYAILSHLIFTTHTVTFYHILYVLSIPILVTTFYISDAYRYFLPHFICPTHTGTS